ncbi:MAG: two-component regulator propeller domain-containing protein [Acidobacteriota bacterium]|nr:two-component regulator propeller domain-containing protein [Acidobacteriota bacterium]
MTSTPHPVTGVLAVLFLILPVAWASQPRFDTLKHQDLTQSTIQAIIQDRTGFIWLGTQGGLHRYDGYDMKVYRTDTDESFAVSHNDITCLEEDTRGRLWVGTRGGGLNRYDPTLDGFIRYSQEGSGLQSNDIYCLTAGPNGALWVGTTGGGLSLLEPEADRFQTFRYIEDQPDSLSDDYVQDVFIDPEGVVWIGTDGGLNRYDPNTGFTNVSLQNTTDVSVRAIARDHQGRLWLGTTDGVLVYQPENGTTRWYRYEPDKPGALNTDIVNDILCDKDGVIRLATWDEGISRYDAETDRFKPFAHRPGKDDSLASNAVLCLYQDAGSLIWIGTSSGVNILNPRKSVIAQYRNWAGQPDSLSRNHITAVYADEAELWVGTNYGLNRMDRAKPGIFQIYHHAPEEEDSLTNDEITDIVPDGNKGLWIGTQNGISRYVRATNTFKRYEAKAEDDDTVAHISVLALHIDNRDRLWAGTYGGGIDRYEPEGDRFIHHRHDPENPDSLSSDDVFDLISDPDGAVWATTLNAGLNCLDPGTGQVTRYLHDPQNPESLSTDELMCLFIDSRNTLWVGTFEGGLNRMDLNNPGRFRRYLKKDGLADNVVNGIVEDLKGNLWISSNNGLTCLNPDADEMTYLTAGDGLQDKEFNLGAAFAGGDGLLYFGGLNGLNAFNPAHLQRNQRPPSIVLSDFRLLNQLLKPKAVEPNSPLTLPIHETRTLNLSYKHDVVSFQFAALDYADPGRNSYAYKLENLNKEWISADARNRFATFTDLKPGDYTLKIKGSNSDGVWNERGVSLDIRVSTPPWASWWAYTLYALLIAVLVLGYTRAQKRKLAYERSVARRLRQLDKLKDEFLANTSHELRTPLNGIIGLTESLIDGAAGQLNEAMRNNLSLIVAGGKRLANLVNDILDFSKLKNRNLELDCRPLDLQPLTDVVLTLSQPLAAGKDLLLLNEVPADLPHIQADENRLQQILFNLVGNAVKFTDSGTVRVTATTRDRLIEVKVTDTGIGIPTSQLERIFESFEQVDGSVERARGGTGLGLAITRKLIELHGGTIDVTSEVGKGSTFRFSLPPSDTTAPLPAKQSTEPVLNKLQYLPSEDDEPVLTAAASAPVRPPLQGRFNILVVDDEPVNRRVLVNHLSLKDYAVAEAGSGRDALQALNEKEFDLILLDIMMPAMSGYEVCRRIRADHGSEELPVIFLTAKNRVSDLVDGFHSGANDYLTKPVGAHELLARVENHLQLMDINRNLEQKVRERTEELNQKYRELALLNAELGTTNRELETLDRIVSVVNRETSLGQVLNSLLAQGLILFSDAEKGVFLIRERNRNSFSFAASAGYGGTDLTGIDLSLQEAKQYFTGGLRPVVEGVYLVRGVTNRPEQLPLAPRSMLTATVMLEDRLEGFIAWENHSRDNAFFPNDAHRLERFNRHAVSAILKARLLDRITATNKQIVDSIHYAEMIQEAILPEAETLHRYLPQSFVLYLPRDIVSGDFYWFHEKDRQIFIAAVDCTGHGIPGAFLAMIGHTLFNEIVIEESEPSAILTRVHRELAKTLKRQAMGTPNGMEVCLCRIDKDGRNLTFAGAGRPLFLVRKGSDGNELTTVKGNRNGLGGRPGKEHVFKDRQLELEPGDTFYLTSDGFVDQNDVNRKKYGSKRFRELLTTLARKPPATQKEELERELKAHMGPEKQRDDVTVLGISPIPIETAAE